MADNAADKWNKYAKQISTKRVGTKEKQKKVSTIMVQRMAPVPTGKSNKYEPERIRDFVNFSDYSSLSLKNIKDACEKFYEEAQGSCDVLFSDRGPSCTEDDQIVGKKVILVRFIKPALTSTAKTTDYSAAGLTPPSSRPPISYPLSSTIRRFPQSKTQEKEKRKASSSISTNTVNRTKKKKTYQPISEMPKSVSIGDVLKAGKLCVPKPETQSKLILEQYDLTNHIWFKKEEQLFRIQGEKFAEGGFREAYKAYTVENGINTLWVIKNSRKIHGIKWLRYME